MADLLAWHEACQQAVVRADLGDNTELAALAKRISSPGPAYEATRKGVLYAFEMFLSESGLHPVKLASLLRYLILPLGTLNEAELAALVEASVHAGLPRGPGAYVDLVIFLINKGAVVKWDLVVGSNHYTRMKNFLPLKAATLLLWAGRLAEAETLFKRLLAHRKVSYEMYVQFLRYFRERPMSDPELHAQALMLITTVFNNGARLP